MQDRSDGRALTAGDYRTGATLAGAGVVLLGLTLTGVWTGPVAVPAALAVALLVFGGYLVTLRAGVARLLAARSARLVRYYEDHPDPVLVTDLAGRIAREAALGGTAAEETADGRRRAVVSRTGARRLLWRIERASPALRPVAGLRESGVPWLRLDAGGAVTDANAAATALGDGQATLERLLADLPLRPDGVHRLAGSGEAVRAVVIAGADGSRDLLLMPLNGAEISGLVPDHFLDELPVALARLTPEGRLTYANRAARAAPGPRGWHRSAGPPASGARGRPGVRRGSGPAPARRSPRR